MPPNKRYAKTGGSEHRGRVTVRAESAPLPTAPSSQLPRSKNGSERIKTATAAESKRYTPPLKSVRLRPGWHKVVGLTLVFVGFTIVILNILMGGGSDLILLPGGHSELYLFLGMAIAGYSMWWFGWFDREK